VNALDRTATNVSNASTDGFRGSQPVFHEVLARVTGGQNLRYTTATATTLDTTPGALRTTGQPLDVALARNDFLAVATPRGERYSRAGGMKVSPVGQLTLKTGEAVLGEDDNPIQIPPGTTATLGDDGGVYSDGVRVARLKVVTLPQPEAMVAEGGTLLAVGGAGAPTLSKEQVQVGMVEESNASPVRGMTDLLQASRLFEAFQKTIQTFHDADEKVLSTVPSH
jgi:flagellar basal body rod protein FlgG